MQLESTDLVGHSMLSICGEETEVKVIRSLCAAQKDSQHSQALHILCFKRDGSPFW